MPLALAAACAWSDVWAQPAAPNPGDATPASPMLSADVIYRILVGEIALQRGDPVLAARAYLEAARESQDARLARRATRIALDARQRSLALEAAQLWQELDPTDERAKQMVAALAQAGAAGELKADLERVLAEAAANGSALGEAFLQLNHALASQSDKTAVFRLIVELAKPYPDVAEAHFAVALAGYNTGLADPEIVAAAVRAANRALDIKPAWERAALIKADIVAKSSPDAAIRFLVSFLERVPGSRAASGALAQLYLEQKRYAEARDVVQRLWAEDRSDRDLELAVARLSVQMRDYATAQKLLEELKATDFGEPGAITFDLAELAEQTKHYDDAIALYREVTEGDRAWPAKLRIAVVLGKKGNPAEAIQYLASLNPEGHDQRIERVQTQALVMREAGDYEGAYAVLSTALAGEPDSAELLYDVAMAAEKLDRLDEVEARLKRLIELKPDNAQALNALGYTLVDRTQRTAEGLKLIEKALALAPADPFILDSMGWAQYRMGNFDDSEKFLRRALADRPDPEIAAHLGEVLWAKGQRDNAREIWQSQLKETPDNPVLLETVRRLAP
ncbi:MAG TPA: tetratricopeptide repeat protein [Casimicrobiaceae bacterium]|nr:tetratricopeptide repeat protein [Casimicrobiaceae bacterium]